MVAMSLAANSIPAKPLAEKEIQKLAREAKTSAQHLEVAGHYDARGRHFEAQAVQHDRDASELANRDGYNPLKHKWPAMVQAPIDKLRAKAGDARREATESFELAGKHRDLAQRAEAATE
jgi:hypothetical protein